MIPVEHGAACTDMQLCHRSCGLGFLRCSNAFLLTVRDWSAALSLQLSLITLREPLDDFDMLKNPIRLVREVVFAVRLHSCSRPNMFVGWYQVEIFSI